MEPPVEHARQPNAGVSRVVVLGAIVVVLGLGWAAWEYCFYHGPQPYTELPAGCPANAHPADTTQLQACLQGLEFDTVGALGDEQRLMVRDVPPGLPCHGDPTHTCRYGPLAKIEPVMGAQRYSDSALQEGRIIARMFLRPGETESYPKLGLVPNDTTYWWVNTAMDSSAFVSRAPSGAALSDTVVVLTVESHGSRTFRQAVARWVWVANDEKSQGTCGSACCR
jgi:hypothetical protein